MGDREEYLETPLPPESGRTYGRTDVRSLARTLTSQPNLLGLIGYQFLLPIGASLARLARGSSANMNFENVRVVGFESDFHERLFLEAWHSTLDLNAGNDHIVLPEAYKGIARA